MHALDHASDYRPADTPVLAHVRGAWHPGRIVAWHRTRAGWLAQVTWRTGPPIWSSCTDFLPAADLRNADTCTSCVILASRWRQAI